MPQMVSTVSLDFNVIMLWKENGNLYSAFCWRVREQAKRVRSHLLGFYVLIWEEEAIFRMVSLSLKMQFMGAS